MEDKAQCSKQFLTTLGVAVAGFYVAFTFLPPIFDSRILTALLLTGMHFGWSAVFDNQGFEEINSIGGQVLYVLVLLILSTLIGWAIFFYRLVKDAAQLLSYVELEPSEEERDADESNIQF